MEKEYTICLNASEWQRVIDIIAANGKWSEVNEIMGKIKVQVESQNNPVTESANDDPGVNDPCVNDPGVNEKVHHINKKK